jgi:hypothetical protein
MFTEIHREMMVENLFRSIFFFQHRQRGFFHRRRNLHLQTFEIAITIYYNLIQSITIIYDSYYNLLQPITINYNQSAIFLNSDLPRNDQIFLHPHDRKSPCWCHYFAIVAAIVVEPGPLASTDWQPILTLL